MALRVSDACIAVALVFSCNPFFSQGAHVAVHEGSMGSTRATAPTAWAGQWIGVVGCRSTCCCPVNYFNFRDVGHLTYEVFGEVKGPMCHREDWWWSNGTVESPDSEVMTIVGPRKGGDKYRIEFLKGDTSATEQPSFEARTEGDAAREKTLSADPQAPSGSAGKYPDSLKFLGPDGCSFMFQRVD